MMTVTVWIEGTTALLQHRATEEGLGGGAATRQNTVSEREDPRTIAARGVYRQKDGDDRSPIMVTGAAFGRLIREAGGAHKTKGSRKSLKYLVPAAVTVLDDLCPLYLRDRKTPIVDFEVDSRPVTIPATKGRVMRHRARFNEWVCRFSLRINETVLDEATVRRLVTEGCEQIGIGDFRPEKGGPFGTSSLVSWEVVSDRKPKTAAQSRNGQEASA
jgi:hypothetical protein